MILTLSVSLHPQQILFREAFVALYTYVIARLCSSVEAIPLQNTRLLRSLPLARNDMNAYNQGAARLQA